MSHTVFVQEELFQLIQTQSEHLAEQQRQLAELQEAQQATAEQLAAQTLHAAAATRAKQAAGQALSAEAGSCTAMAGPRLPGRPVGPTDADQVRTSRLHPFQQPCCTLARTLAQVVLGCLAHG